MLKSSGGRCRRAAPRVEGLKLNRAERQEIAEVLRRVEQCGTGAVARRRLTLGPLGVTETRTVARTECGQRWCPKCEAGARRYREERALGPWGMLVTLTLDPAKVKRRSAWRLLPKWVGRLLRRFARRLERRRPEFLRVSQVAMDERARWEREQPDRERAIPKCVYAWAIEPHETGYPHAHICLGLEWLDADWLREQWRRITSMPRVSPQIDKLDTVVAVSRYLSKYITKAVFSIDLCVLTRRRRLFWSAIPIPWEAPDGWQSVDLGGSIGAEKILSSDGQKAAAGAWIDDVEPSKDYRKQSRIHARDDSPEGVRVGVARRPPVDWDGPWWKWYKMVIDAEAISGGQWAEKEYHKARRQFRKDQRDFVARVFAVKFMWGWSLRCNLRTWRPRRFLKPSEDAAALECALVVLVTTIQVYGTAMPR